MTSLNQTLLLRSTVFNHQDAIPEKYTCDGADVSPPLTISGVPQGAESLAIIVHDPDAPGGNWDHWLLWNIAPDTTQIFENTVPEGASAGMNDFGKQTYGGPCPPSGTHRYVFTLYALDRPLRLSSGARRHALEQAMQGHILAQTELIGLYTRQRK
jgi:Raf kinase inhibitor-like YbhB/YbcL family protein